MFASRMLRGSSMPNDARVYMNALTLIVFALFNLKKARQALGLDAPGGADASGGGVGAAFTVMGVIALTVHLFAGPTHTWGGINYADVWHTELQFAGWGLVLLGIGWIAASGAKARRKTGRTASRRIISETIMEKYGFQLEPVFLFEQRQITQLRHSCTAIDPV